MSSVLVAKSVHRMKWSLQKNAWMLIQDRLSVEWHKMKITHSFTLVSNQTLNRSHNLIGRQKCRWTYRDVDPGTCPINQAGFLCSSSWIHSLPLLGWMKLTAASPATVTTSRANTNLMETAKLAEKNVMRKCCFCHVWFMMKCSCNVTCSRRTSRHVLRSASSLRDVSVLMLWCL